MGTMWCLYDLTPSNWCKMDVHSTIDHTLKRAINYAVGGQLRKISVEKAWNTIKELEQYEGEGWNDLIFPKKGSLNYETANMEKVSKVMEGQIDSLINDVISLIGKSENLCGLSNNKTRQLPPEPSHQKEFKGLVMNFILDQEEKVRQLEEYMRKISKRATSGKNTKGQSSSSHEPTIEERVRNSGAFDNDTHEMNYNALVLRSIHSRAVIDWSFLAENGLERGFFESIHSDPFSGPHWSNLFLINELVYRELVQELFSTFELEVVAFRNNPEHARIHFRLGGEQRMLSLVELGWRVGLYSEAQGGEHGTVTSLYNAVTVKAEQLIMEFFPTIRDGVFSVRHIIAKRIRDPRIRLAHRCIKTTISDRKDSTQRITVIDLFNIYCIYGEGVVCNISYWIFTKEMLGALSVEPRAQVLGKKSLITMEIVMELAGGKCHWPATQPTHPLEEDDEDGEAVEGETRGSSDAYRGMSRGDWQNLSTRDNLEPHLQIHPFPGRETDYPPFGYTGPMPLGYDYRYDTDPGRKAHLLEDKKTLSVWVFDEVSFYTLFQAFGRNLEVIHVTWTQFGKKRDRIATLLEDDQVLAYSSLVPDVHKWQSKGLSRNWVVRIIDHLYQKFHHLRVHDYQLGLESYQQNVNLTAPTITFPSIERKKLLTITSKPVVGLIYENSKKEKRVMIIKEIPKFYDATLIRVLELVEKKNMDVKHGYEDPKLIDNDAEYLRFYEEYIKDRLRHRD
ncbi:hypothetical protein Tco_0744855 [Tanacetum coccineum]